jgi:hypothetical protein
MEEKMHEYDDPPAGEKEVATAGWLGTSVIDLVRWHVKNGEAAIARHAGSIDARRAELLAELEGLTAEDSEEQAALRGMKMKLEHDKRALATLEAAAATSDADPEAGTGAPEDDDLSPVVTSRESSAGEDSTGAGLEPAAPGGSSDGNPLAPESGAPGDESRLPREGTAQHAVYEALKGGDRTAREVAEWLGTTPKRAQNYVSALQSKGSIRRRQGEKGYVYFVPQQ